MSGDSEQEYFSDGITEDIITDLSKVSGLFVIARNSTFVYKGKPVQVQQVGRDLGVRYVLEGSVRKAGDKVRITAQLVEATTGNHLWAERYDCELKDIFAVQDEVAEKVVSALAVTLKEGEEERLGRKHTPNLEAYDLFLQARAVLELPSEENVLYARKLFDQAIELDANFAGGSQARLGCIPYGFGWDTANPPVRMRKGHLNWRRGPWKSIPHLGGLTRRWQPATWSGDNPTKPFPSPNEPSKYNRVTSMPACIWAIF